MDDHSGDMLERFQETYLKGHTQTWDTEKIR